MHMEDCENIHSCVKMQIHEIDLKIFLTQPLNAQLDTQGIKKIKDKNKIDE